MADEPASVETSVARTPERDERGNLSEAFVEAIRQSVASGNTALVRELAGNWHETDVAELLMALDADERAHLVELLGKTFDFTALTELDESARLQILDDLPSATIAEGMRELDSDDAVYILEDLETAEQDEILAQMPADERVALKRSLDYPEESAGRRMQTEFIAVPPLWTVGQTIDHLRREKDLPDEFYEIFVVDPRHRLLGTVSLNRLLRNQREVPMATIMDDAPHKVSAVLDQEEVARLFGRYNLVSAPVVDEVDRLVGVITVDDIVDVIQEEAEEDIRLLAGVGDEEVSDTIAETLRSRFTWLLINLGTAVLASLVIAVFDGTIEEMVALAILMPIVASMGGNAATQTMTVAVRALATREIGAFNIVRVIYREGIVGLLNGMLFAVIIGVVAAYWFANLELGGVIAAAMVINMIVAGLSGILIPIGLDRLKIDPAIASGVFVTTMTDVIGFFAFLGIAAWWFQLG